MANKKKFQYKSRLAAIFASFTILITGAASLLGAMSLDYYSVLGTLQKAIPASFVMGTLGWVMGAILDQPRRRPKEGYTNMFVKELMKKELEKMEDELEEDGELKSEEPI